MAEAEADNYEEEQHLAPTTLDGMLDELRERVAELGSNQCAALSSPSL